MGGVTVRSRLLFFGFLAPVDHRQRDRQRTERTDGKGGECRGDGAAEPNEGQGVNGDGVGGPEEGEVREEGVREGGEEEGLCGVVVAFVFVWGWLGECT